MNKRASHHGICLPLFSLHSKKSSGIGEFLDLLPLIDWLSEINFDILQLLPLNEMDEDNSPYNAISSLALDPIYISLSSLPHLTPSLQQELSNFKHFNLLKRVSYSPLKNKKLHYLHDYFLSSFDNHKPSFKAFIEQNEWITTYSKETFHLFLQYLAFSQMKAVKTYAESKKVFLLGDMPLFISQNSIDVNLYPQLFNKSFIAGAPPDNYNPMGQKWCFFIYNWEEHKKENFAWWKKRLAALQNCYHLYRIDHVVGLFRIFAMQQDETPLQGEFFPKDISLWEKEGKERLSFFLKNSPLLPIAEDLGFIPKETYKVLKELKIPGTKVMRWQKNDSGFIPIHKYDPLSLTTLSTHDSETLQLWWQNHPEDAFLIAKEKGWTYFPSLTQTQRFNLLKDSHHTTSLFHINLLQEYLALFPDLDNDQRINVPGIADPANWTYRFKPSIEELVFYQELKDKMIQLST